MEKNNSNYIYLLEEKLAELLSTLKVPWQVCFQAIAKNKFRGFYLFIYFAKEKPIEILSTSRVPQ
jgi:hypothetical protein